MVNKISSSLLEIRDLTDEILVKAARLRELILEEEGGLKALERPSEYLYKEALNFKYRVYDVPARKEKHDGSNH